MVVIKNKKNGMWEGGLIEEFDWRKAEYPYEIYAFCGYLFEGFGAESKIQYVSNKEAHY